MQSIISGTDAATVDPGELTQQSDDSGLAATLAARGIQLSIVIPTLNEAENIPHVFARLPDGPFELILVDGRSSDDTVAIARAIRPGIQVVREERLGKGAALEAGFAAARGDIIVMLDADGSTDPAEIPRFVGELLRGADLAKGSRFIEGGRSTDITFLRRLGNRALCGIVNLLFGVAYSDLCYGYNAFWARHLQVLNLDCDGFEVETLLNLRAAQANLRVVEVPSFEHERLHGHSKLRVCRDGTRVLATILRQRFGRAPRKRLDEAVLSV